MGSLRQLATLIEHFDARDKVTEREYLAPVSEGGGSRRADEVLRASLLGCAGIEVETGLLPAAPARIA